MTTTRFIIAVCALACTVAHAQFERKSEIILPISLSEVKGEWIDLNSDSLLDILLIAKDDENNIRIAGLENKISEFEFHDLGSTGMNQAIYTLTDFNHDGTVDLIINGSAPTNDPGTFVFLNQGNFSFQKQNDNLISLQASILSTADFDNDGQQEILLAGSSGPQSFINIYQSTPTGYSLVYDTSGIEAQSLHINDFMNDGRNHLFISGLDGNQLPVGGLLNNQGEFRFQFETFESEISGTAGTGDINHDGWFDIVISGRDKNNSIKTIRYLNSEGSFNKLDSIEDVIADELLIADFNSDGQADFHLSGQDELSEKANRIIYPDQSTLDLETLNLYSQRFGDFERDGDLDFFQVIDSTSTIKKIRLYENIALEVNLRPGQPVGGFAISTFNRTFLYWIATGDDLTPVEALTYDVSLSREDGGQLLFPNFSLTDNLHRTTVSHGHQGTSRYTIINALTDDRYYYYIQSVDNAFNGSQACTGGVLACFDLEKEELQACTNETVRLGMPESAYWFSLSSGFLGETDTLSWTATASDTVFAFIPQQVDCSKNKAWAITVNDDSVSELETIYFCEDEAVTLKISNGWDAVVWKNESILATDVDSLTITFPKSDTLLATGSTAGGCTYRKEFYLVQSKPDLKVENEYFQIMKGQSVILSASGGESYEWSPAFSLNQADISNPTATPLLTTTFIVTAKDSIGCMATATVIVEVTETAFIPNLFTPNGDGKNDEIRIFGITQANIFEFRIYNREGSTVYRTQNLADAVSVGWNGQHNGIQQPNGLYYWKVDGVDSNGKPLSLNGKKSGSILLVR
jgi:gliding motility-associated-like protein